MNQPPVLSYGHPIVKTAIAARHQVGEQLHPLDPATIRDISGDVLGPDGRLQILPAAYWASTSREERALFGRLHGIYTFPTDELVDRLVELIAGRTAIEIGAGHGVLAQALDIPATDSMQQVKGPAADLYVPGKLGPPAPYGPNLIDMHASRAVRQYRPQVVIGSWITGKSRPDMPGNDDGVDELDILAHCETNILIGHTAIHHGSALWTKPHTIEHPDYLFSRAMAEGRDFLGVWRGWDRRRP